LSKNGFGIMDIGIDYIEKICPENWGIRSLKLRYGKFLTKLRWESTRHICLSIRKVNIREGFDGIGIYRPVEVLDNMKTVQDYMNDPRLTNDPAMKDSLELSKEIHAIRLKIQDENEGLSVAEINRRAETTLASWGISLFRETEETEKNKSAAMV
jgi:hypothetical protein